MLTDKYLEQSLARIIDWNLKACKARYGHPYPRLGLETWQSQESIWLSERREHETAGSVLLMLDGAIDELVTVGWLAALDIIERHEPEDPSVELDEWIVKSLHELKGYSLSSWYAYSSTYKQLIRVVEQLYYLERFGIDVANAIDDVLLDNESKFTTQDDADLTIRYAERLQGVPEYSLVARKACDLSNLWAVVRKADLKIMKPRSYYDRAALGKGLNLTVHIPPAILNHPIQPDSRSVEDDELSEAS